MEKRDWNKCCRKVFSLIMHQAGWSDFKFPGGMLADRAIGDCLLVLRRQGTVDKEKLVDFCVCQGYAISGYGKEYRSKWKVTHSFGGKAIARYGKSHAGRRYYEDLWLKECGLSRDALLASIADRRQHPFERFIYPEYEDHTKKRLLSTEAGYTVCVLSTLLWTPFSPVCRSCKQEADCRTRTKTTFPELYRIRCEAWRNKEKEV